jgi:acyl-[acyl-carrier-protein]-phospholipid O-acyltransferase/long-chain-fatty-acid--[acyl-carrier-protein] ligase
LISSEERANTKEIQSYFKEAGLSELWVPKKVVYMRQPPVLGTGKFDYQTAKKLILEQN